MYNLTNEELALFTKGNKQVARITFEPTEGEEILITEADIINNGLSIERHSISGETLELGSAIASELSLVLNNTDGRFNDVIFEGAELYVTVGTKDWAIPESNYVFVPMGFFTVDEAPRKLRHITLTALDRMVLFDKPVSPDMLSFPINFYHLISRVCDICNVPVGDLSGVRMNMIRTIPCAPNMENMTYRQLLSWACELSGACAYIDCDGRLCTTWYKSNDSFEINPEHRFSSDLAEKSITISGIQIVKEAETVLAGDDAYALNIEGNGIAEVLDSELTKKIIDNLNAQVPLTYTPYSMTTVPLPHISVYDRISFVDKDNNSHSSIITNYTFSLNGATAIEAKGKTATNAGYASVNSLTRKEAMIIRRIQRVQNETLNSRIQSVIAFNELISNALGLWATEKTLENGSVQYYMHNKEHLEESTTIFTINAGGIAWTNDGWNGGEPVWQTGVTAAGDALFKLLSAEGIKVSKINEDYSIEITPTAFNIYYKSMPVTVIEKEEMTIPRLKATNYIEVGKTRDVPYYSGGNLVGTNKIFID